MLDSHWTPSPASRFSWSADDLREDHGWVQRLSDTQTASLAALGEHSTDAALPALAQTLERVSAELTHGRGIFLLQGIPHEGSERKEFARTCLALVGRLGRLVAQDMDGTMLRWVEDQDTAPESAQALGHRGSAAMDPHSDSAAFVGLFCMRPAKCGGATVVASAESVFHRVQKEHPGHLATLESGFHFDMAGKSEKGVSERKLRVFDIQAGRISCHFNRRRIVSGAMRLGVVLSDSEMLAIDHLNQLAKSPTLALRFHLAPGDALFLSNRHVLHGRDEYEDWPERDRRRLLLRLWFES